MSDLGDERIQDLVAFLEGSDDFVCLATTHGKPFYLNQTARRMLGLKADEPAGNARLQDFYAVSSWEELRDVAVPAVNATGRWEGRSRLRASRSGGPQDVATALTLVKRAGAEKATCFAIVHRVSATTSVLQTALDESETRKHAILESSLDPIVTIDHDGVITEFNRAAEQAFGHAREKIIGTRPSDVLFPPSQLPGQQDRVDRYLQVGEGSMLGKRAEVSAVRANGEVFPAEMAMTMGHEHGAPVLTFFIRDISARKRAEAEQARYAGELERSNEELRQFAYVASHDLQEPLRKILAFGQRLSERYGGELDDAGRETIERMANAARRMQALIDGLLTLSHVATHAQQYQPVNLVKVVQEVVSDLDTQIERVSGRVEIGSLPVIQADPLQMRQLFQNLIANALKFHRPDEPPVVHVEGRLLRAREQRGASVPARQEMCCITVEDNGIGFEEKFCERIFGVFQRLHTREVYEGTGIGLAICQRIVQRHGGTIKATSVVGQGSVFEIILPVRAPTPAAGPVQ